MQSLFKILIFGLMFCLMAEPAVCAENDKKKPGSILRFLQANRAKREIMLATGKIDKDAKVYYLYEIDRLYDEDDLEEYVDFMAPALRAIFRKGANLIMYTNKYISGSNSRDRHNDLAEELRLIRKVAVKCPIVNTYKESTRKALFKDATGTSRYSPYTDLCAVDEHGIPLAHFSLSGSDILISDAKNSNSKILVENVRDINTWQATAIIKSVNDLVKQVNERDAATRQAEEKKEAQAAKEAKPEPEPAKPAPTRWKKVRINR